MENIMKKTVYFSSYCGCIISFRVYGLDFINLEDAKKFVALNKTATFNDIKISEYFTVPAFVNMEKTIENNNCVVYYELDELQLEIFEDDNP